MKTLILSVVLAVAMVVSAAPKPRPELTPEQKAANREKVLAHTGGMIERPGTGSVAIVNVQKRIPEELVEAQSDYLRSVAHVAVERKNRTEFSLARVDEMRKELDSPIALFIVDDSGLPMSLIALEGCWGVLNIAQIMADSPSEETAKTRFQREFVRVTSVLFSGCCSQYKGGAMHTVTKAADLDKLFSDRYTFDYVQGMAKHLPNLGITQFTRTIYKKACEEGWAPPPTNDYQKAIWERVKADKERGPTNPITIPPPNAKK